MPPREALVGRGCRLEPLDVARHADALWDAYADDPDGAGWRFLFAHPPTDRAEHDARLAEREGSSDPLFFAVVPTESGAASGVAAFMRILADHGVLELGHIHFAPRLARTRAATEALSLMLGRAFDLGYRRVEWRCDTGNVASRRAAQRLGFSYEGVFRQHLVIKDRNRDSAWFSLLDGEWPAVAAAHGAWLDPGNFDAEGRQRRSLSSATAPLLAARDPALRD